MTERGWSVGRSLSCWRVPVAELQRNPDGQWPRVASTEVIDGENPVLAGHRLPEHGLVASAGGDKAVIDKPEQPFYLAIGPCREGNAFIGEAIDAQVVGKA